MAFAIYKAPRDFSDGSSHTTSKERHINIRVQRVYGGPPLDVPVSIVRPPVVLVHGLWGSPDSWSTFLPLFGSTTFLAEPFDYRDTNADSFRANADLLADWLDGHLEAISENGGRRIAVAQADFVAHSMGGNVVRTLPISTLANAPRTFGKGYIHKLITIGTPHLGSSFAKELLRPANACAARFFTDTLHKPVRADGAVGDLSVNADGTEPSDALRQLGRAPTAMIAGRVAPTQIKGLAPILRYLVQKRCGDNPAPIIDSFSSNNYNDLMGSSAHDGLVTVESALNGQYGEVWGDGRTEGGKHSATLFGISGPHLLQANSIVSSRVIELLNSPVSSSYSSFSK